jgi:ribosomal protein S18 acetylase RimI-like enzyme
LGFLVDAGDRAMSQPKQPRAWTVHPVGAGELDQVLEVYRQCEDFLALGPQPKASIEMVLADLRLSGEEGGTFYGIYEGEKEKMIGVVDYVPGGFEGREEQAFLSLLMIAAPYRSQGIGAEVVRWVEEQVANRPEIQTIFSGVQANNPGAIRFWERMGFSIIRGPEVLPDTTVAYTLRKELRTSR